MGISVRRVKGKRWLIGSMGHFDRSVTGAFDAGPSI
jgi:hypothetical protein